MSLILSLETSGKVCSAAIYDGHFLMTTSEVHIEHSHASRLASIVDEVKNLAGIELEKLSAVAISSGPGSYTGLRIGTSTAKGLCFALGVPLIAVGSLELLAFQMRDRNQHKAFLCPMIDARRMEVYTMVVDSSLRPVHGIEAKVIDASSFDEFLNEGKVLFFGDGADKCRSVITHENAEFVKGVYQHAEGLGMMAFEKFQKQEVEDLVNFEPHYLKEFLVKKPKEKV
jgi:tRNA threonylcarbamoyladenosine biosynthesis protein TsaB